MFNRRKLSLLTVTFAVFMMCSCSNREVYIDKIDDSFPDKPLDSCLTQGEINQYFARRATRYQDSVTSVFYLYADKFPSPLVKKELDLWKDYDSIALEVYKRINMTGFCGSAAPMGLFEFAYDIVDQFLSSFAYEGTRHMQIAAHLVDEAYSRFMNHGIVDDYVEDDPDNWYFTLEDKKNCLTAEHASWNRWIAYREEVSSLLQGKDKKLYDMRTNELRRMKLIQLKNQYQWYGLNSDEWFDNQLDPLCTDKELQNYTFFDSVWKEYEKHWDD